VVRRRNGLRDKWRAAVLVNPDIDGETRAMLFVLADRMTDAGRVSVTRKYLADIFNVHERRISDRVRRAVDAGLLSRVGGGYRGRAQIFDAVIPARKGADFQHPLDGKGCGLGAPFIRTLSARATRTDGTGKGADFQHPNARVTNVTIKNAPKRERRVLLSELSPWARLGYAPLTAVSA
jgi:hypothetical protein